jgi:anti-sigma-K factor RskA
MTYTYLELEHMLQDEHAPFRENIPAYAIGALDAEDITALESHLKTCATCQAELAEYRSVTIGLLQSAPPRVPSPELRHRLAARLPKHQPQTHNVVFSFLSQLSIRQLTTAAIIMILLASNLYSNLQVRDLQRQQAILAERLSSQQKALALLAYPETQALTVNANIKELTGSMLVDKAQNTAVLFLWHLPQLENTKTYQAWLVDATGDRISGGLFNASPDQGYTTVTIQSPVPMNNFIRIGVTIEPQGGSQKPTGPRVLTVNL